VAEDEVEVVVLPRIERAHIGERFGDGAALEDPTHNPPARFEFAIGNAPRALVRDACEKAVLGGAHPSAASLGVEPSDDPRRGRRRTREQRRRGAASRVKFIAIGRDDEIGLGVELMSDDDRTHSLSIVGRGELFRHSDAFAEKNRSEWIVKTGVDSEVPRVAIAEDFEAVLPKKRSELIAREIRDHRLLDESKEAIADVLADAASGGIRHRIAQSQ